MCEYDDSAALQHQWELEQQERIESDPVYRAEFNEWLDKLENEKQDEQFLDELLNRMEKSV
jgi:hypothetical protein